MDNQEYKEEERDQGDGSKGDEIQRITVSKQVQDLIAVVVERVNDGFIGGKVNRTQIANWIIQKFSERLTDTEVKEIRSNHFDEITLLESILRQAKASGKVPTELKEALLRQAGNIESAPKKKRKMG